MNKSPDKKTKTKNLPFKGKPLPPPRIAFAEGRVKALSASLHSTASQIVEENTLTFREIRVKFTFGPPWEHPLFGKTPISSVLICRQILRVPRRTAPFDPSTSILRGPFHNPI